MFKKRRTKKPPTVNTSFPYLRQCLSVPIVSTGKVTPMTPYTLPDDDELTSFDYLNKIRDLSIDIISRLPISVGSYFSFRSRDDFGLKSINQFPYFVARDTSVVWKFNRANEARYTLSSQHPDDYDDATLVLEHFDYGRKEPYRSDDYRPVSLEHAYRQICDLHKEFIKYMEEKNG